MTHRPSVAGTSGTVFEHMEVLLRHGTAVVSDTGVIRPLSVARQIVLIYKPLCLITDVIPRISILSVVGQPDIAHSWIRLGHISIN